MLTLRLSVLILFSFFSSQALTQVAFQAQATSGCAPFGVVIDVMSPTTGITSYAWNIITPTGTTLTASNAQYVSIFNTPGTYSVSLTINGNQTQTIEDYITVYAKPTASFTVSDYTGCYPHCVQYTSTSSPGTGQITTYTWDFGNGSTGNTANPNNCYQTAGNFVPILTVTDENGCFSNFISPNAIQVSDDFPHAQFTSPSFASCSSPATFVFENSSTGNSALSATWNFGDGTTSTNTTTANHSYNSFGSYEVCLTVIDAEGCSDEDCQQVEILSEPEPSFTASALTICAGQGVTFTSTTSPTPSTYAWDFNGDGVVDQTSANPTWLYTTAGTYTPTLTVGYGSGCTGTISGSPITVQSSLSATISATATSGCEAPFTTTLTAEVAGTGTFTYNWIIGGQPAGTTQSITHTFNNNGAYNVAVSITSSNGCSAALSQSNFINVQSPAISFEAPQTLCFGEAFIPENFVISGGAQVATYAWDFDGDGTIDSNEENPSYIYSTAGTYTPVLTVNTTNGCTSSFTATEIEVMPALLPTFNASQTISCAGQSIEFCIPAITGATYSWNFHDESGWITMLPEELCIQHMYEDTGYFDLSLSIVNGECSLSDTLFNYIYIEPPVALFEFSVDCNNMLSVTVSDQSIGAEGLSWDFGDGSAPISGVNVYTHTYADFGDYEIVLTATSSTMTCPDEKSHTVNLHLPSANIDFTNTNGCGPLPVQLTNTAWNDSWDVSFSNGYTIAVEYLNDQEMFEVVYEHDNMVDTTYAAYGAAFWPEVRFWYEGCYDVEVNALNAYGCPSSSTYSDVICVTSSFDFASFTTTPIELCDSVHYAFSPIANNITSSTWTFSDGGTSTEISPEHVFLPPYDYSAGLYATVVAVNSLGCTSEVTQAITGALPAIPSFDYDAGPHCQGAPVSFTNTTEGDYVLSTWNFGDLASDENTSNTIDAVHSFTSNGLYEVCLTVVSADGCERTACAPQPIEVANPDVSFTYTYSTTNCLIGVSFENTTPGNNATFTWDFGDNQIGTGASTYHTYPLGVFDVTLTVQNAFGCVGTFTFPDIFDYSPVIGPFSVIADETPCAPFDVELSAFNINDTSFSYFWDFNDGNGDPTGNTQVAHQYTAAGTYCPQLIMTDAQGCQVLIPCENPIVVEDLTIAYSNPNALCAGESLIITLANASEYAWSGEGVVDGSSAGEFIVSPATSTTYTVTGTLDDCVASTTIDVTVYPLPIISFNMPEYVCYGVDPIELTGATPEGGVYAVDGFPSSVLNVSFASEVEHTVDYSFVDENGCSASVSNVVYVRALPDVYLNASVDYCENTGAITLIGGYPTSGTYYVNDAPTATLNTVSNNGEHTLTYEYTDAYGCANTATQNIIVHAAPAIAMEWPMACERAPFLVNNTTTSADGNITTSFWEFENGIVSTSFQHEPFTFSSAGIKNVHCSFSTEYGCTSELDTIINVLQSPVASFSLEDGCQNELLSFTSTSTIEEGEIVAWNWGFQDQAFEGGDFMTYAFNEWGTLSAVLTVTADNGCSSTVEEFLTILPSPQVSLFSSPACVGQEVAFDAIVELSAGEVQAYQWNFDVDSLSTNVASAVYHFDAAGQYTVRLSAFASNGCVGVGENEISVYDNPEIDFAIDQSAFCAGEYIQIIDLSSVTAPSQLNTWEWYLDNTQVSNEQNAGFVIDAPGLYVLRLKVTSNHGCVTDSITATSIQINPNPIAGFHLREDEVFMSSPKVHIENTSSEDVTSWLYAFGDGEYAAFSEGHYTYSTWGNYTVTQIVTNVFGCTDTAYRTIGVSEELLVYIPNAFTPDGNGNNDVFKPVFHGAEVLEYEFFIFDRWGKVVFFTKDIEGCWDGSVDGYFAQDGVYNWTMKVRSKDQPVLDVQQGTVTLLR